MRLFKIAGIFTLLFSAVSIAISQTNPSPTETRRLRPETAIEKIRRTDRVHDARMRDAYENLHGQGCVREVKSL